MSRTVKNYEIRQDLGEGAMGMVYYAIDLTLQREAALKSLRPDLAQQQKVIDRFRMEAQTQAKLNHQNIAHIYEYFQFGSEHFLAMEYINGKTLSVVLRERGRLPLEEAGRYIVQALRGLAHAHRHRVIHRDVKPANLMLNADGVIKVTDFGIARVVGADRATRVGMLLGTFEYISPEAVQLKDTTELSDLYSTGIVLFELVTGQLPFTGEDYELVRKHVDAERPSLRDFGLTGVPSEFEDVIQRAMNRNPRKRFRSADEMADALQGFLDRHRQRTSGGGAWWRPRWGGAFGGVETTPPAPGTSAATVPRRADISSATHRVEDLLERHHWDDANKVVDDFWRIHPGEPELMDLRNRIQRQRQVYEQTVQQHAVIVRDLLDRDQPEAALSVVQNALAQHTRAALLVDLKRECNQRIEMRKQRAEELAQIQRHVDELTAAAKYQEAADYILDLQEQSKDHGELGSILRKVMQARKEYQRNQAILQILSDARTLADRQCWEEALSALDLAVEKYSRDPRLTGLRSDVQAERRAEQIREAVEAIVAAAAALEKSSPEDARQKIASGLNEFPENARLKQELERLDAILEARRRNRRIAAAIDSASKHRRQRRWPEALTILDTCRSSDGPDPGIDALRELVAAEYQAHQALLERFITQSRQLIESKAWEEAILKLSSAVREMPGEGALVEMLQEAHQGLAKRRRAETAARIKSEAEAYIRSERFDTAIQSLLDAVSQYPEDPTLSTLLSQAVFARDAFIARQQVNTALEIAAGRWERREYEQAIAALRQGLQEVLDNAELLGKLEEYEEEWKAVQRKRELNEIAAAIEAGIQTGDFKPALERAAEGAVRYPGDKDVLELQARAAAEQRRAEAGRALAEALASGLELEEKQSWDAAAQVYEKAQASYPELEAGLRIRLDNARAREMAARRAQRLATVKNGFHKSLNSGHLDEAGRILNEALQEFADEASFKKWQQELADAYRLAARAAAIRETVATARKLIEQEEFDDAERVVSSAEREHGADRNLRSVRSALLAARSNYASALESALKGVTDLVESRDWDTAIAEAEKEQARFPREPRFKELTALAAHSRHEENRKNHLSQIRILLGNGDLDHAEVLVRYARSNYPNDTAFQELERELGKARDLQAYLEAFARQRLEIERLAQGRQWARAKELLQPYLDTPQTQDDACQIFARLDAEEMAYGERTGSIDRQARELIEAKRFEEAAPLLSNASAEFPEIEGFGALLRQARLQIEREKDARLLDETECAVRDLVRRNQPAEALALMDRALADRLNDARLRDLRAVIVASIQKQESISAIAGEVQRLIGQQRSADAERALIEGLRRFPSSSVLQELRALVDAARKAEWEREAREADRNRAVAEIQGMIGQHQLGSAAVALEGLTQEYGMEAGTELAQQLALARQADDRHVSRFLAGVDRLRSAKAWSWALALFCDLPPWIAEDSRVADRRDLVSQEVEAERARQAEQQRAEERRRKEQEAATQKTAAINREIAEIQGMIAQHQFGTAAAALEALTRDHGAEPGAELAKQLALARQADEQQVSRLLADVDSLRSTRAWPRALALFRDLPPWMAEDSRVVDRRELVVREVDADRARQEEQRLIDERRVQEQAAAAQKTAAINREIAGIQGMIGQHQFGAAAAAMEALTQRYGAEAGAELAQQLTLARQADEQQVCRFLADVDSLRSAGAWPRALALFRDLPPWIAEDGRVVDRQTLVSSESEAARLREEQQRLLDERRRQEQEAAAQVLRREIAEIQGMIGEHQFGSAAAALEALTRDYGADAGKELAELLTLARQADEHQVSRFLAGVDRLRSARAWPRALALFRDLPSWIAEDSRIVDRHDLVSREAEAERAREDEQRRMDERRRQEQEAAAQKTAFINREIAEIQRIIGEHQFGSAAAALAALTREYGVEAGVELAQQLALARQADDEQVSHFLAGVDRLRSARAWPRALALFQDLPPWIAQDSRVVDRYNLVYREAEVERAREEEQKRADERKRQEQAAAAQRAAAIEHERAQIQRMIGQHQLRSAAAALEALSRGYGEQAFAELPKQLALARQADDEQVCRFLADVDRLGSTGAWLRALALFQKLPPWIAEDSRVVERRDLATREAQAERVREEQQRLIDERIHQEQEAAAQKAAAMNRERAQIQRMIGQHQLRSAVAALEALSREYGEEAGGELAKQLAMARQADDQQVSRFLADVDRLRFAGAWPRARALFQDLPSWIADDGRVVERRDLVALEAEAGRVREPEHGPIAESGREEQAARNAPTTENIAAVADEVHRLTGQQRGVDAERVLFEGLRRFPSSPQLQELRPLVDAARKAEWERESREANRHRKIAEIQRMIGQHKLRSAATALEALGLEYGTEAGGELAEQLAVARQADDQQVSRFLADVDRLRSAKAWPRALTLFRDLPRWIVEDQRVINRRDLVSREAEAAHAGAEQQRLIDELGETAPDPGMPAAVPPASASKPIYSRLQSAWKSRRRGR
jgi:serine/threonine-protein kinase